MCKPSWPSPCKRHHPSHLHLPSMTWGTDLEVACFFLLQEVLFLCFGPPKTWKIRWKQTLFPSHNIWNTKKIVYLMLYPARGMNVNICGKGVRSPASSTRSFLALKQFLKDAASGKIWTQSLTFSRCEIESCSDRTETTPKTSWGLGGFDECKSAHWTASKIPFAPTQFPKTNLSSQTKVSSSHQFF